MAVKPAMPRVSVVMSTCNNAAYLRDAIDSILNQSFAEFEFIIINDGSTDKTETILQSYDDRRIIRLKNNQPSTLPVALNQGIAIAQGDYIARMDSDDIALPQRLEKQVAYLDTHSDVGIIGTNFDYISTDGQQRQHDITLPINHSMIVWRLFTGFALLHPSVMMRTTLLKEVGGYDEAFTVSQDRDLWIRCLPHTTFANLSDKLMLYRVHEQSATQRKSGKLKDLSYLPAQHLYHKLTGQQVDLEILKLVFQRSYMRTLHTQDIVEDSAIYLLTLYDALVQQGWIHPDDQHNVRRDLSQILLGLGRQSPQGFAYLRYAIKAFSKWILRS